MFHKHKWKKVIQAYSEPINLKEKMPEKFEFGFETDKPSLTISALLQGCTTILRECEICHEIERYEMLGKEVKHENDGA